MEYYSQFFTETERLAVRHHTSTLKLADNDNPNAKKAYEHKGWLTSNKEALELLKDGYECFALKTANRILEDNCEEVVINNCQKCGKLARTPTAKQCRHCGHDWH